MELRNVISLTPHLLSVVLLTLIVTVLAQPIQLSSFLPQLISIHESCKTLAHSNTLLRDQIVEGLRNNHNRTTPIRPDEPPTSGNSSRLLPTSNLFNGNNNNQTQAEHINITVNYEELENFNSWVGVNLDYAIKNTLATAEALKDEAMDNNGTVEYSLEFIEDGKRGVQYWQSAVSFQEKTLKNEKFEIDSI